MIASDDRPAPSASFKAASGLSPSSAPPPYRFSAAPFTAVFGEADCETFGASTNVPRPPRISQRTAEGAVTVGP